MVGLPYTLVYDRGLYAGGYTVAEFLSPMFGDGDRVRYNYGKFDDGSVRPFHSPAGARVPNAEVEEGIDLLWGLGLQRRVDGWSKPVRLITFLRHPVHRMVSILRSAVIYSRWKSFWEAELWPGSPSMTDLERVVDRYGDMRPFFQRSQFTELMDRVDYAGLEFLIAPGIYDDGADPLLSKTPSDVIIDLERRFSEILVLELQEEAAICIGIENGLDLSALRPMRNLRHDHLLSGWSEMEIPDHVWVKMARLLKAEILVYNYFRAKFEQKFFEMMAAQKNADAARLYVTLKSRSMFSNSRLRDSILNRTRVSYFPSWMETGDIKKKLLSMASSEPS